MTSMWVFSGLDCEMALLHQYRPHDDFSDNMTSFMILIPVVVAMTLVWWFSAKRRSQKDRLLVPKESILIPIPPTRRDPLSNDDLARLEARMKKIDWSKVKYSRGKPYKPGDELEHESARAMLDAVLRFKAKEERDQRIQKNKKC